MYHKYRPVVYFVSVSITKPFSFFPTLFPFLKLLRCVYIYIYIYLLMLRCLPRQPKSFLFFFLPYSLWPSASKRCPGPDICRYACYLILIKPQRAGGTITWRSCGLDGAHNGWASFWWWDISLCVMIIWLFDICPCNRRISLCVVSLMWRMIIVMSRQMSSRDNEAAQQSIMAFSPCAHRLECVFVRVLLPPTAGACPPQRPELLSYYMRVLSIFVYQSLGSSTIKYHSIDTSTRKGSYKNGFVIDTETK